MIKAQARLCLKPDCEVCPTARANFEIIEKGFEVLQEVYEALYYVRLMSIIEFPTDGERKHGFKLVSDAMGKALDLCVVDTEDPPNEDEDTVLCDCCGCAGNHSMPDGTPCKHAGDGVEDCALGECGVCQCCMNRALVLHGMTI